MRLSCLHSPLHQAPLNNNADIDSMFIIKYVYPRNNLISVVIIMYF